MQEEFTKEKNWIFRLPDSTASEPAVRAIADALGIPPIVAKLLYCRGYETPETARGFLAMESELLCDPFLMKDADPAARRILRAVENGERITVFGDYDVDGVTAVSTLYLYLRSVGADVGYYIPNRATDGYGVSNGALDGIFADGTKLIVTVDTGITAINEVEYAREHGVDFVVTDHHECHTELPHCPTVNPHRPDCPYPFKELSGVGVVFKLITAAEEIRTGEPRATVAARLFSSYADLVAIGTIADVMPVTGENRIIVSYGLHMMERPARVGLVALMDAAAAPTDAKHPEKRRKKPKITSSYIGYTLAPRINAAGRIMSASMAVELFLAEDYHKAYAIAEELCDANRRRQAEENKIIKEAYAAIEGDPKLKNEDPVIVLHADSWHHGVIGIVASRITERYCRPS
ncbi:MAG TPA: single-stranded-DNA-specific exonuclease RecJ, partial [Clostridiales bacterium]|nr:single-stranded-DNA-specific exonuclease RecJ [Clostridiales bacterium]